MQMTLRVIINARPKTESVTKPMKIAFAVLSLFFIAARAFASLPFEPTKPTKIVGTVVSFVWIAKTTFELQEVVMTRSLIGAKQPSRYYVILQSDSVNPDTRKLLSSYAVQEGVMGMSHPLMFDDLKKDQIIVRIATPKLKVMKLGARVEIREYTLSGDSVGSESKFEALLIDGVEIKKNK